jgi:cytidine deaminase
MQREISRQVYKSFIFRNVHVNSMNSEELLASALKARSVAYSPYSKFAVGAALEAKSGRIFTGCNVENLSFGLTICAERNAVFAAVAAGEQNFVRIVIVADSREPVAPCGACRQVLAEFGDDVEIRCVNLQGQEYRARLSELLPRAKAGILDSPCPT